MRHIPALLAPALVFLSAVLGFLYELIPASIGTGVVSVAVIAIGAGCAAHAARAQDHRSYYTPLLMAAVLAVLTLSVYTGWPYGTYEFTPVVHNVHLTLTALTAVIPAAITTWWYARFIPSTSGRVLTGGALFAPISLIASHLGVALHAWTWTSHPGLAGLGGFVAGTLYAMIGEWRRPRVPDTAILFLTPFAGFSFGAAITTESFFAVLGSFLWTVILVSTSIHE
jgi:hypothetical protein